TAAGAHAHAVPGPDMVGDRLGGPVTSVSYVQYGAGERVGHDPAPVTSGSECSCHGRADGAVAGQFRNLRFVQMLVRVDRRTVLVGRVATAGGAALAFAGLGCPSALDVAGRQELIEGDGHVDARPAAPGSCQGATVFRRPQVPGLQGAVGNAGEGVEA